MYPASLFLVDVDCADGTWGARGREQGVALTLVGSHTVRYGTELYRGITCRVWYGIAWYDQAKRKRWIYARLSRLWEANENGRLRIRCVRLGVGGSASFLYGATHLQ